MPRSCRWNLHPPRSRNRIPQQTPQTAQPMPHSCRWLPPSPQTLPGTSPARTLGNPYPEMQAPSPGPAGRSWKGSGASGDPCTGRRGRLKRATLWRWWAQRVSGKADGGEKRDALGHCGVARKRCTSRERHVSGHCGAVTAPSRQKRITEGSFRHRLPIFDTSYCATGCLSLMPATVPLAAYL